MEKSGTGDVNREGVWLWIEDQQRWDRKRCGRRCLYKGLLKPLSEDDVNFGESMCLEGDRTQCL